MDDFNPLKGLFDLAGKTIDARAAKDLNATTDQNAQVGVDEYGRAFLRGTPSAPGMDPRLIWAGVALVVVVAAVLIAKA